MVDETNPNIPQITVTPVAPGSDQPKEENTVVYSDPGINDKALPPDIAKDRAAKAKLGLGPLVPQSLPELQRQLEGGEEEKLRKEIAARKDVQDSITKQRIIRDMVTSNPGIATQDDVNFISNTFDRAIKSNDPKSIFEDAIAQHYTNQADRTRQANLPDTELDDVAQTMPKVYNSLKATTDTVLAKREFAITQAQNAESAIQNQSWFGFTLDMLKQAVPLYTSAKLRGWMKNTPVIASQSGFGLGANLYDQTRELLRLPMDQYKAKFTEIMEKLTNDNPTLALTWARAVAGMSTSEENLNSAFEAFDIATIGPAALKLGKAALRKAGAISEAKNAMKDLAKSAEGEGSPAVKMAQGAGDNIEAGVQKEIESKVDQITGNAKPVREGLDRLPSYLKLDAENQRKNPGSLGRETANRIAEQDINAATQIMEVMSNRLNVDKMTVPMAVEGVVRGVYEGIKDDYRGIANSINDIRIVGRDPITNTFIYEADIIREDGKLFSKMRQAQKFAEANGLDNAEVMREGSGYKLVLTSHVKETSTPIREGWAAAKDAKSQHSWVNSWFNGNVGKLRTPEDVLSFIDRENRKAATYAPASIMKLVAAEAEPIQSLARKALPGTDAKQRFQDWQRIIDLARYERDAEGNLGKFYDNIGELDHAYLNHIGRLPEEQEAVAYFAFKRINEIDRILRNIRLYANKARLGVEQHRFSIVGEDGKRVWSPYYEGAIRNRLPGGDDGVLIVNEKAGTSQIMTADQLQRDKPLRDRLQLELGQGKTRGIEIYSVDSRPLAGFDVVTPENRIRYVFTNTDHVSPLSWNQIPRRGAGHFEYDFEHLVVQPIIRTVRNGKAVQHWYEGDATMAGVNIRAMGKDAAEKMTATARLLEKGDEAAAKAYWEEHFPMGMGWDKFKEQFESKYVNGVKQPPRFRTDMPFMVVPKGTKSVDIDKTIERLFFDKETGKSTFHDGTRRGSMERNFQVEYTAKRDNEIFPELINNGTAQLPAYGFQPAKMVDPIPTMNRAIAKIANTTWVEDYKHQAIERWLAEALPHLDGDIREIRSAPFWFFANADQRAFKVGADPKIVDQLLVQKHQIDQFLGMRDRNVVHLERAAQNMLDAAYEANKGIGKARYIPAWLLPKISEPFSFIRAVVFNENMGLWNWTQVFNQLQSFVTIYGVAGPTRALPGSVATLLHEWAGWSRNPNILRHLDELAVKVTSAIPGAAKFKPGEFTESMQAMERSGFNHIGSEFALINDKMNDQIIKGNAKTLLEKGQIFFKWPESKVRMGAWHTAYIEFRELKPFGRLTNEDELRILNRADDLYSNMSRASVSLLQQGIASVPTQFFTYMIRSAELFLGKRLGDTPAQRAAIRARLFATMAAAYGVPSAMGLTGFPAADFIKKAALGGNLPFQDKAYVPGDNLSTTAAMEGLFATLGAVVGNIVTGAEDPVRGGTYYDMSSKGISGLDLIKEVIRGDKSIWQLFGGAAGSSIANTWEQSSGLIAGVNSMIRGDGKFPIKAVDFLGPFREIRSLDKATRLIAYLNTGRWLSKSGTYMDDVTKTQALLMTALGLNTEDLATPNLQNWDMKSNKDNLNTGYKKFAVEWRRAVDSLNNDDPEQATQYFTRARNYLIQYGYDESNMHEAYARIQKENDSLVKRTNMDYYIKKPALKDMDKMLDAFQTRSEFKTKEQGQ